MSTDLAKVLWRKSIETVKGFVGFPSTIIGRAYGRVFSHSFILAVDPTLSLAHGDDVDFENFVNSLNDSINPLDLEFVRLQDEETGKEMRALVRMTCLIQIRCRLYGCLGQPKGR